MQLYCPPSESAFLLVIDPVHNVTDGTTLGRGGAGFGYTAQTWKWGGFTFCGLTNKVSFVVYYVYYYSDKYREGAFLNSVFSAQL